MRNRFDNVLVVDWSARREPAPKRPSRDAIWLCFRGRRGEVTEYCRTRLEAEAMIHELLATSTGRCFAGFDFSFAYPAWAMERLGGWEQLWAWLEWRSIERDRFQIAAEINSALGVIALWGAPKGETKVPAKKPLHGLPEFRACELSLAKRPHSPFKLLAPGSVGSQMLLGIPVLERLRRRFGGELAVWPFEETTGARIALGEVWPSLLGKPPAGVIPDQWQVEELSRRFFEAGVRLNGGSPVEGGIAGLE